MACPAGFTFDALPRKAPYAEMTETFQLGTRIVHYGNDITWSDKHLPASRLEPLRQRGDELADNALEALKIKPGEDAYKVLLAYIARPEHEQESSAPRLLMKQLMTIPDWVDWQQVHRGQQVFWRYCFFISHALLHFSLAGGFAIPKITKVLTSTGYLSGSKTKERVYETCQFVFDVAHSLEHLQPGTGPAWESIVQVRFLHAGVRSRLSKISRAHSKYYSLEEHGVPINQEDLLATLFSFSNTMWRVMESKMNVCMSRQEREDYLHLWRYVGYLIGVDDILGVTRSPELADACLESIVLHLVDPDMESGKLCASLLKSMAAKPKLATRVINALGLPDPFKFHLVMAESLLGVDFWKVNGLPSMTRPYWFFQKLMLFVMLFDLLLISMLPWLFQVRSLMVRKACYLIVAKNIGKSRTRFELKEVPKTQER